MSRHCYTQEQCMWLEYNSRKRKWKSIKEFTDAFNRKFQLSISPDTLTAYMYRHGMPHVDCETTDKNQTLTEEQKKWIEENRALGIFKDKKHFIATFNAVFNTRKSFNAMNTYMARNGIVLTTKASLPTYTKEQEKWLRDNYDGYEVFADFVRDFNSIFGTSFKHSSLATKCKCLGLHTYDKHRYNRGQFKKGQKYGSEECPIGTIKYNKQRNLCFIKVRMCEGKSRDTTGHNFKEPFWKPLQDKIWEDNYGAIPDGYIACSLNDNPYETNIENIALIDKRGKCIMTRRRWWTDINKFTATGVQWCNLYFVAKDHGVFD